MKIGKKFNQLSKSEYHHYIDNHKKYTDFNTLGLYRSIMENDKLDLEEKQQIRDYAHQFFQKTFDFFQLKDPGTYFKLISLGREMTISDERQLWDNIRAGQQKILADKKFKHRNFGIYSKHSCGYEDCHLNGLMIRQGSWLAENEMHFHSDKSSYAAKNKAGRFRKQRKNKQEIIRNALDEHYDEEAS